MKVFDLVRAGLRLAGLSEELLRPPALHLTAPSGGPCILCGLQRGPVPGLPGEDAFLTSADQYIELCRYRTEGGRISVLPPCSRNAATVLEVMCS